MLDGEPLTLRAGEMIFVDGGRRICRHAHDYVLVFNSYFKARQRVEHGQLFQITGRDVEAGVMPGTNDAIAAERAPS